MKKSEKFANITLLTLMTLLFFVFIYKATTSLVRLHDYKQFLFYCGIPIALLILLFFVFRLKDSYKVNCTLAILTVVVSLYAVEGLLAYVANRSNVTMVEQKKVFFDRRSRFEVINDLKQEGKIAFPPIPINQFSWLSIKGQQIHPLAGISGVLTVCCNEDGRYLIYESDEHGFNNPQGLYHAGQIDIAILGDSFAQGDCVQPDENAAAVIRGKYPLTLNLGYGGSGPLSELASLKEYARPLVPKIVLWFYYEGNDLNDLEDEKQSAWLRQYLRPAHTQGLSSIQPEIDQLLMEYYEKEKLKAEEAGKKKYVRDDIKEFLFLNRLRVKLGILSPGVHSPFDVILFKEILSEAQNTVRSWGGQLYFVYLPAWPRFSNINPDFANPHRQRVVALVNDLNIPFIDIEKEFRGSKDPLSFFPMRKCGHYNKEGYQLVGTTILDYIAKDNMPIKNIKDHS